MKTLLFKQATFLTSALPPEEHPSHGGKGVAPLPSIVIAGRSNVGKSSVINSLTNRKSLAKTSSTPGKTQRINYFLVDEKVMLVDLPGYGYAKVGRKIREEWAMHIEEYLRTREGISLLLLLFDIRRTPSREDLLLPRWALARNLPVILLLTKTDKVGRNEKRSRTESVLSADKTLRRFPLIHYSIRSDTFACKRELIKMINALLWA
ncbi:MAG: ribosome biogenesis GTP-binding protein YihA/YsxC [Simkaniaceae bacterium]|nr:ribosome biogenesis GTP-binding protein YihA/YsxC [Simkaniaceae bacterium]